MWYLVSGLRYFNSRTNVVIPHDRVIRSPGYRSWSGIRKASHIYRLPVRKRPIDSLSNKWHNSANGRIVRSASAL
jgi:hypothetical protein